jgi:hypothetical protein
MQSSSSLLTYTFLFLKFKQLFLHRTLWYNACGLSEATTLILKSYSYNWITAKQSALIMETKLSISTKCKLWFDANSTYETLENLSLYTTNIGFADRSSMFIRLNLFYTSILKNAQWINVRVLANCGIRHIGHPLDILPFRMPMGHGAGVAKNRELPAEWHGEMLRWVWELVFVSGTDKSMQILTRSNPAWYMMGWI